MRKINIILALTLTVLFGSCMNLDLDPLTTGSSETWYSTESEIKMSLLGLYRTNFWAIDDHRWSDDHQNRNSVNHITGGTINSEVAWVETRWTNCYKAIGRANTIIKNLEASPPAGISDEKKEQYIAEALFVRACMYGTLTTYWGDVVYTEDLLSIEEAFDVGRTDRAEIMEYIYRDLDIAANLLPDSYTGEAQRATRGAAYAMKARYALFNEHWDVAAEAAWNCMELGQYSLHPDFLEYFLPSTRKSSESILYTPRSVELDYVLEDVAYVMAFVPRNRGGYASQYPSWELFCAFLCTDGLPIDKSPLFDPRNPFKNRDPRCTATVVEFGTEHLGVIYDPNPQTTQVWSSIAQQNIPNKDCRKNDTYASYNGLILKKGVDESWVNDGAFKTDPDRVIIRYADVLLIYAEAKIEADDIDQTVLDAINKVRARAYGVQYTDTANYPAVVATDQTELRKILRIERRMEFAFEGGRYMDLIRWRLAEKAMTLPNYGMLDVSDLTSKIIDKGRWFFPYTPAIDDDGIADFTPMAEEGLIKQMVKRSFDAKKQYLWPIPSKEVLINPNIGQNDNY